MTITGLDHVSLLVSDMAASVRFYTEVLKLEVMEPYPDYPQIRWLKIGGLDAIHLTVGDRSSTHMTKTNHLAVATDDIDAFAQSLSAKGIKFFDWPGKEGVVVARLDGVKGIYFQDPDGYWIEVNDRSSPAA
jgi:catechol 2,3-dioxygenase-like lactoylglutathione lyase family enzyme